MEASSHRYPIENVSSSSIACIAIGLTASFIFLFVSKRLDCIIRTSGENVRRPFQMYDSLSYFIKNHGLL